MKNKIIQFFRPQPRDLGRLSWKWGELMDELRDLQNNGENEHVDLLSITGFMHTLAELEAHVKRYR